jgi:hypothetical protein
VVGRDDLLGRRGSGPSVAGEVFEVNGNCNAR